MRGAVLGGVTPPRLGDFSAFHGPRSSLGASEERGSQRDDLLTLWNKEHYGWKRDLSFNSLEGERALWRSLAERSPLQVEALAQLLSQVANAKVAAGAARKSLGDASIKHTVSGGLRWPTVGFALGVCISGEDDKLTLNCDTYLSQVVATDESVSRRSLSCSKAFTELFGPSNSLMSTAVGELSSRLEGEDREEQIRAEARALTLVSLLGDGVGGMAAVHALKGALSLIKSARGEDLRLKILTGLGMEIYDVNRRATAVGLYSLEELALEDRKTTRAGVNQALQEARPLMETVYQENVDLFRNAFGSTVQLDDLVKRSERQVERWLKMYVDGGVSLSALAGVAAAGVASARK